MSEVMDKIYCMPDNNNCAEVMAMMNNNNWMNNPFMYLIWLAFFGNNGFGNGRFGDNAGQIAQLQDSVNTNHNNDLAMQAIQGNGAALHELAGNLNVGVSALSGAITGIRGAIDLVGANNNLGSERVINSILLGNKDLTQQLAQCCCDNKQLVTTMGYEGQLRDQANTSMLENKIDQLTNGMQTGFATAAYETSKQTNALQNSLQGQTQTIIDKLNSLEFNAQQEKINTLTAQLTASQSRAERAAELAPIIAQLDEIRAKQPATATVPYPQLTVYPSYLNAAAQAGYYGGTPFWS